MSVTIAILCVVGFGMIIYIVMTTKTKSEKEAEEKLRESLEDDRIFDPETGVYISLEEAESGNWSTDDREKHAVAEMQITDDAKEIQIALDYLFNNDRYEKIGQFPDEVYDLIETSKILSKYEDWSYSNVHKFEEGFVFLPAPQIHGNGYHEEFYSESQIMFFVKIAPIKGHYYLREKVIVEKFFDMIRSDDHLVLKGYESFTFRRSRNLQAIQKLLKHFEGEKRLEIELNDTYLFIKTLKFANIHDVKRIERIIQKIVNR